MMEMDTQENLDHYNNSLHPHYPTAVGEDGKDMMPRSHPHQGHTLHVHPSTPSIPKKSFYSK